MTLRALFDGQAATALRLRTSTATERRAKIHKLREAVLAHADAFREAARADFGKPPAEVDLGEILPVCMEANEAIAHLAHWMKPKAVWPTLLTLGTGASVTVQPRGRCLILSPWNYALNLSFGPLISAIAAGNTIILKPSELTPHQSALMAKIIAEVFTPDEVAMVEGDAHVAKALLALPFDHIFFTGSPAIGKQVMQAAAQNLSSVTLELGGKSPTIIDSTADLKLAAQNVLFAKCGNAGQTCVAVDHVFIHESVKDAWVNHCRAELTRAYGSTAAQQQASPYLTRVVNARHVQRLKALLEDAVNRGARVLIGGTVDEETRYIQPTLLDNVPADARIMDEEIFGPLLPVISYRSPDEVIARVNTGPKPLALYVFSRDKAATQHILENTTSGGACVNHSMIQFLHGNLPFGGVGNSGFGNAHGYAGFKAFSHERAVVWTQLPLAARLLSAGKMLPLFQWVIRKGFRWL